MGKSTGQGALSLWTHTLRTREIIQKYSSSIYKGPAIRLGAGVRGYEAYETVNAHGYRAVGGDCPTVGITGGYAQGGGHSLLASTYGMAADQVLEWEVVTTDGDHLTATPTQNIDLYWALSGGGSGTFAVVLSMVYKIYPDGIVDGASFSFNKSSAGIDAYNKALAAWWQFLPSVADTRATVLYSFQEGKFFLNGLTAPGSDSDGVSKIMQPYLSQLKTLGVPFELYLPNPRLTTSTSTKSMARFLTATTRRRSSSTAALSHAL